MAVPGVVDFSQQKSIIKDLIERPLFDGAKWYVVDGKWFSKWKTYVGFEDYDQVHIGEDSPGPVDNSCIVKDHSSAELRLHLLEGSDYVLVPEEAWNKLVEWYTVADGQEPLARGVIKKGLQQLHKVEVYPTQVKLCRGRDMEQSVIRYFSCMDTLETVLAEMRRVFEIPDSKEVQLLSEYLPTQLEPLTKLDSTLEDAAIGYGHVLVIEEKTAETSFPRPSSSTDIPSSNNKNNYFTSSSSNVNMFDGSSDSYSNSSPRDNSSAGLCGLSNLGNTCFMNSALQCMSNVPLLTDYMLSSRWKEELNTKNPLGMRGEIASTYAALIQSMWSGKHGCAVPRNFKVAVGRFKPEFSGYQQQDSQELMAFLLDGLHEDLNRIRQKPYVETKEMDGQPDEEVARKTWEDYRLRNDSIIVDIFHGLLKSTLVCPVCSKISIKFDPFCYLSLPLPVKKERQMVVYFVSHQPIAKIRQCKVTVPKMGCVRDMCIALANLLKVAHDRMLVVDVYNHRFHKVFSMNESLTHITERDDIYIFETPLTSFDDPDYTIVPVYMREVMEKRSFYTSSYTQLFGMPILITVKRKNTTYSDIYKCILSYLVRCIRSPAEDDVESGSSVSDRSSDVSSRDNDVGDPEKLDCDAVPEPTKPECDEAMGASGGSAVAAAEMARLFTVRFINTFGSTEAEIADDGKPISFDGHNYLAADWTAKNRSKYYDEEEAKVCDVDPSMEYVPPNKKQTIQLTDCLELFTTKEKLGEHDLWYCPKCKNHQQATKKFDIWDLPRILVIHLKRFSYSRYWRDKLDTYIDYPVRGLDMSRFVFNKCHRAPVYDLIAVSNHYGGLGGGHYTAYAKNCRRDQWYHFDDSSVSAATEDSVVTKAGYVLVYQRRMVGDTPDSGIVADSNNGNAATSGTVAMDV